MENNTVNQPVQTGQYSPQIIAPVSPLVIPITNPAQNPSKNSNLLLIILAVAILIIGIVFGVLVIKLLSDSNKSSSTNSPSNNVAGTGDWLTYSNKILRYSIKYPPTWTFTDNSKGKLIEIYNQPNKTNSGAGIYIEKISLTPININEYVDTIVVGNTEARCFSDNVSKTWCYIENGKSVKISILIVKDQNEAHNSVLYKILSTFYFTPEITKISEEQLAAGWYWGSRDQKIPGTPLNWIYTEAGKSSCWHKKDLYCQVPPSTTTNYTCPENGWVDCMPTLDTAKTKACSIEAMNWYKTNCPNFQGAAL